MEGVTIIETKALENLKLDIKNLNKLIIDLAKKVKIDDPLLTSVEVQEYLQKGSTWLDANKHKIGCSKIGGEWRFRKSEVDNYINNYHHKDN